MSATTLKKDLTTNIVKVKKMPDYGTAPGFKKKAEEAAAFLQKHGLLTHARKK